MQPTTKTIASTIGSLMLIGMLTSLVQSSETYFVGQASVARPRAAEFGQSSVLSADEPVVNAAPHATEQPQVQPTPETSDRPALRERPVNSQANSEAMQNLQNEIAQEAAPRPRQRSEQIVDEHTDEEVPELTQAEVSVPPSLPIACEDQNLFTYRGADYKGLLYGSCIPCAMNKFNIQEQTCAE